MNDFFKGALLSIISAVFWAIGGNFTQYIYRYSNFDFVSLTGFRMLVSGILILILGIIITGSKLAIDMLKDKEIIIPLIIFSIFAQLGVQLPFFATIKYSSAAFATLTSALAPVMVLIYLSIKNKKKPKLYDSISIIFMILGLFFVITNGNIKTVLVDIRAVIWGVLSAMAFSFYLLYSHKFFKYPSTYLIGYSMIIGSLIILPFSKYNIIYNNMLRLDIQIMFILLIIIGTIIPFYCFIQSTRYVSPKITSILSVLEPITSLFITIFIFKEKFTIIQLIGVSIVIISVTIISYFEEEKESK